MNAKGLLIDLGKLLLCGLAYFVGLMLGGMVTTALRLPPPPMPAGVSQSAAAIGLLGASPMLALGLALLAPHIAGRWPARTLMLAGLLFVAYSLNTLLDASLYVTGYADTSAFMLISSLVPSLLCGAAAAWLFAPASPHRGLRGAWREFFGQRTAGQWLWRLALAAVAFAPVYILFGLMVNPFTEAYYAQNLYGLHLATWGEILPMQLARSGLFLAVCLPIIAAWQGTARSLFLRLGGAQFALVGLTMALVGTWLPWLVRLPHTVEILADSFVYAGLLVWLLARPAASPEPRRPAQTLQQAESRP